MRIDNLLLEGSQEKLSINTDFILMEQTFTQCLSSPRFLPGKVWNDNEGNPINAHGGGILWHEGVYYWYGEQRPDGPFSLNALHGISCYSSTNLVSWKFESTALPVATDNSDSPLKPGCKMERPKVIYNAQTHQFVMWWHHDLKGWGHSGALAGVAISDSPTGPFHLVRVSRPGGMMFRDCTVFQDEDGVAWLIFATDDNANLAICRLDDTYLNVGPCFQRVFPGRYMEAPCVFKHQGVYYIIASDWTGWYPNEARSAFAPTLIGPWKEFGNPCIGNGAEISFGTQSTFVLPLHGKPGAFIFMADLWNPENLYNSRYAWLPIYFKKTVPLYPPRPLINWMYEWDLSIYK